MYLIHAAMSIHSSILSADDVTLAEFSLSEPAVMPDDADADTSLLVHASPIAERDEGDDDEKPVRIRTLARLREFLVPPLNYAMVRFKSACEVSGDVLESEP